MTASRTVTLSNQKQLPDEAIQAFSIVQRLLGPTVVGVYLFGSAVVGGLRPDSDVDVMVVVRGRLSEDLRRNLVTELMGVSGRDSDGASARPIELTVVNLADIVPWRYPPKSALVYGEWLRGAFENGQLPQATEDADLAILLATVRRDSVSIFGPPSQELLDPVPKEHVRLAISESLPNLIGTLKGDERNVLLTLARMWTTLATGEIVPKDVAADWVLERLPEEHRALLDTARRAYLGEAQDDWAPRESEVIALVNYVKQSIESHLGESRRG